MEITIWTNIIELDVKDEITIRHMRKIYPLIKKHEGDEMEMIVEIVKVLSLTKNVEEVMNNMNLAEFTELAELIKKLLEKKK